MSIFLFLGLRGIRNLVKYGINFGKKGKMEAALLVLVWAFLIKYYWNYREHSKTPKR